jgi:hypothetical protein
MSRYPASRGENATGLPPRGDARPFSGGEPDDDLDVVLALVERLRPTLERDTPPPAPFLA